MMENRIVTVGTFDGLHRGHRLVVDTLLEEGRRRGLIPMVITFANHPLEVVAPERAPKALMDAADKVAALRALGPEVEMLTFDPFLCSLTAREWMLRLRTDYGVRALVLGHDNTFGSDGRTLTHADYHRLAADLGIDIIDAPALPGISSSAVRRAVAAADMEAASRMLGRPYAIEGRVIHGRALGRTIGFPTANLAVAPTRLMPPAGVYSVDVDGLPDGSTRRGVLNIGRRPTVGGGDISVECHIIGYDGDIYGLPLRLHMLRRLRSERRFDSLDELREAIAADVRNAAKGN